MVCTYRASGPFDRVCFQCSASVRKTQMLSARASSPSTSTANSTLGIKKTTLRPWQTIYYFLNYYFPLKIMEKRHENLVFSILYSN